MPDADAASTNKTIRNVFKGAFFLFFATAGINACKNAQNLLDAAINL